MSLFSAIKSIRQPQYLFTEKQKLFCLNFAFYSDLLGFYGIRWRLLGFYSINGHLIRKTLFKEKLFI